jgi:hypothetical protein
MHHGSGRIPLWLKISWTIWLIVWALMYWRQYGAQNFLFFCDIGNVLIGIGLWLESPLIFSWTACGVLAFQTIYTIDLVGALFAAHHSFGGLNYMFDPQVPLAVRLLSLFHVVTPPLLVWAIWRVGYDPRGWKVQTLMTWVVIPINYLWRPQDDVNWARGLFFHEQHVVPGWAYLLLYLTVVPVFVYFPTHLALRWATAERRNCGG